MKIINLSRSVGISNASSNNTLLTINTSVPHNMVTGDLIKLNDGPNASIQYIVTVTGASAFTIPSIVNVFGQQFIPTGVFYPIALRTAASSSITYAIGSSSSASYTFQAIGSTSAGAGASVITIEVSNDGVNWITQGTITLTLGDTSTSDKLLLTAPWGYIRAVLTSISGTNAKVNILLGTL